MKKYRNNHCTSSDFAVSADGGQRERSDEDDYQRYEYDHDRVENSGLSQDPRHPQEEHDAPNAEQTRHQHALGPS